MSQQAKKKQGAGKQRPPLRVTYTYVDILSPQERADRWRRIAEIVREALVKKLLN